MKYTSVLIVSLVLCSCLSKKNKLKTGLEGKPMPSVSILEADSTTIFNTKNIVPGKPTLLFSFATWCPYCKAETEALLSNLKSFNNVNIYMICNSRFQEFKKFNDHYKLDQYPNIKAGVDKNMSIPRFFNSNKIPILAVYDANKKLKRVFIGITPISAVKDIAIK